MNRGKILILEANRRGRLSRSHALSREGYRVTSVSSVEEAAEAAKRQPYELLVSMRENPSY